MVFIKDFLDSEIIDMDSFSTIYDFIALDNFRCGEYEGNQYVIRKVDRDVIEIEDEVATENTGISHVESYSRERLLQILENYKENVE